MVLRWVFVALSLACAACSGSSSESPWPVEPLNRETAPVGETETKGNVIDPSTLEDRYSPGAGGAGGADFDDELDEP